jgi:hypothetical protein
MTMVMLLLKLYLLFRNLFEIAKTRYATSAVAKTPITPDKPTLRRAFSIPEIP